MSIRTFLAQPVGAAVVGLAALVLVLGLSVNLDRLPVVGAGPEYRAVFGDASGLQNGEEVRVAGIKVGEVTSIDLDGDRVVVTFQVKGQRLGLASRASIEIKTLLGQHFLAVTPDGPGQLEPGSVIPLERTSTPVQIVPTVNRLVDQVDRIDTARVATAFETLADALHGTAPEVRGAVDGLTTLSRTIATRDDQVQQLLARARDVTGVIAAKNTEVTQLVRSTNDVLEVLDRRRDAIHALLVGTRDLSTQLSGVVRDNQEELRPALDRLNEVIEVLRRNDDNLSRILTQLPPYLRLFTNLAGTGPWFDTAITAPRGFAVCTTTTDPDPLVDLMNPALAHVNQAVNGSSAPCLPLGPGSNSVPPTSRGGR